MIFLIDGLSLSRGGLQMAILLGPATMVNHHYQDL